MPSIPSLRQVIAKLNTVVLRAIVGRTTDGAKFPLQQVNWSADRTSDAVEYLQSQGCYFRPIEGAEGLFLTVAGEKSNAVLALATKRDTSPGGGEIEEGEGGLYFAGTYRVFLDKDGLVHLGDKTGAQFVALADDVRAELDGIKSDLDAIKAAYDAHTHPTAATGPPSTPTAGPVSLSYSPTTPAATNTKAT